MFPLRNLCTEYSVLICVTKISELFINQYMLDKRKTKHNIITRKQVQLNGIEKYFHRPRALKNI